MYILVSPGSCWRTQAKRYHYTHSELKTNIIKFATRHYMVSSLVTYYNQNIAAEKWIKAVRLHLVPQAYWRRPRVLIPRGSRRSSPRQSLLFQWHSPLFGTKRNTTYRWVHYVFSMPPLGNLFVHAKVRQREGLWFFCMKLVLFRKDKSFKSRFSNKTVL